MAPMPDLCCTFFGTVNDAVVVPTFLSPSALLSVLGKRSDPPILSSWLEGSSCTSSSNVITRLGRLFFWTAAEEVEVADVGDRWVFGVLLGPASASGFAS